MASMDHSSLVAQLWTEIKSLTSDDITFCVRNCSSLLEPGSKLTSVLANPGSYNTSVILALILLHRYSIWHTPQDIARASDLMLQSITLTQESGYAFFIFTLASRSLDFFEEGMGLGYLVQSIELLKLFISNQKHGSAIYLMAVVKLSCACLQYYLKINEERAFQSALDALQEGRQNSPQCRWISSFGEYNSLLIVADVLRHRYEVFGQQGSVDFEGTVSGVLSILDLFPTHESNHCTALEALVVSTILGLAQTIDCDCWLDVFRALHHIITISLPIKPLIDPLSNLSHLPSEGTLQILSKFIKQCPSTPTNRAVCLIYMADILQHSGTSSQQILDADDRETRPLWEKQWMLARKHLQGAIYCLQTRSPFPSVTLNHFRFQTKINDRPSPFHIRFRQLHSVETHICMFDFVPVPVSESRKLEERSNEIENFGKPTHAAFLRGLRIISNYLSQDELEYFVDHPEDLDRLFNQPRFGFSRFPAALVARWKQSPGVIAILIMQRSWYEQKDIHRAGSLMLTVKLDREPAYQHFFSRIANELRHYEKNVTDIGNAGQLLKEFLRVQTRGSPKHFFAVMELALVFMLEFLHREGRSPLVAASLELFREGVGLRGSGPWMLEARKTVVLGRIMHNRHAMYFEESDEALEETSRLIMDIWDLLPSGRPFRASVIEMIVITALLYLSKKVETSEWHEVLRLLKMGLDLYLYDEMPKGDDLDSDSLLAASQVLFDSGIGLAKFSLTSEAMCLIHMSDIMRSTTLDATRWPGCLALSVDLYERNLRAQVDWKNEAHGRLNSSLIGYWTKEQERLYQAVLVCTQRPDYPSTFERLPLSIFGYRACTLATANPRASVTHACLLQYYLTWTSYLPQPPLSTPSSPTRDVSESCMDAWPDDFLSPNLMSRQDASRKLPSTIIPGFEKIVVDEGHQLFKMPLEQRTIRALIRRVESQVRSMEDQSSRITEALLTQSSSEVYWDPRDVQLNTRVQSLKNNWRPHLVRIGPLQALLSRGPEKCLEMVESSRALFWTRLLRLRTSFIGLPQNLADELEVVAHELNNCASQSVAVVSKEELQKQFELESIFSNLLAKAQRVPGFEKFLMPKTYDILMEASCGGPVVVLVGSDSIYAALVARVTGVDSVFLPALTDALLEELIVGLNRVTKASRSIIQSEGEAKEPNESVDRYGRPRTTAQLPVYEHLLNDMWKVVVKPIFEHMGYLSGSGPSANRPRLWWCPTGRFAFLPIHAAGSDFGKSTMEGVSKYVISSYTPTLSALISARSQELACPRVSNLKALVLAQPTTEGYNDLPMTIKELEFIENLIPSVQLLRIAEGPLACSNANRTVDEATVHLTATSILHLACHGHQDRADPLNSGFELADGRLTVSKLISCHTPNAFLAFLSACESASNDLEIPDESLNLSAAMLYAGFRSVIGTMWSMNDNDGPYVSHSIYQELFKDTGDRVLDPDLVPVALDSAVLKLQKQGVYPGRWATYIHVGV